MERADRVQIVREALRTLAAQLQPQDKLSVVNFARTARLWVDGVSGTNALAVFFLTGICAELLGIIRFAGADGKEVSLHGLIFSNLFLSWASPINASLAFAVSFVLVWLGLMWLLYRRNIFIKV